MSSALEARPLAGDPTSKLKISLVAGKPAPKEMLVDLVRLEREYFVRRPALPDCNQLVSFETSGHRGSSLNGTFIEAHVPAITQAICDYRRGQGTDDPLYIGKRHARALHTSAATPEQKARQEIVNNALR